MCFITVGPWFIIHSMDLSSLNSKSNLLFPSIEMQSNLFPIATSRARCVEVRGKCQAVSWCLFGYLLLQSAGVDSSINRAAVLTTTRHFILSTNKARTVLRNRFKCLMTTPGILFLLLTTSKGEKSKFNAKTFLNLRQK